MQVKYEMLRRVSVENASVTQATEEYGVSRPTYYQAKANFERAGIAGLVPKKRGPRGPHKLQGEVLAFLKQQLVPGEPIRARELAKLVRQEFDLERAPQDDRASGRVEKKLRDESERRGAVFDPSPRPLRRSTSLLRMAALGEALPPEARSGLVLFLRRGMWAWARTLAAAAPRRAGGSRPIVTRRRTVRTSTPSSHLGRHGDHVTHDRRAP